MRILIYFYRILGILLKVFLILFSFVVVALVATLLIDDHFNTLPITNYCFAIFAGISSICFSWARNIDNEKLKLRKAINDNGEKALLTAITFLLASILRYLRLNTSFHFNNSRWLDRTFMAVSKDLTFSLFSLSVLLAGVTLGRVFMLILDSPRIKEI